MKCQADDVQELAPSFADIVAGRPPRRTMRFLAAARSRCRCFLRFVRPLGDESDTAKVRHGHS